MLAERMTYYLLRAPTLARLQAELGVHNVLEGNQINRLMDDLHRTRWPWSSSGCSRSSCGRARGRDRAACQGSDARTRGEHRAGERELSREREAAVRQVMLEQREAVLALLKSDELAAVVHRASMQGETSSMPSSSAELCSSCSGWWPTSASPTERILGREDR